MSGDGDLVSAMSQLAKHPEQQAHLRFNARHHSWKEVRQDLVNPTQEVSSEHEEKMLFIVRLTEHWHRLPRKVVESSFLVIIKPCLDMVLDSLL